MITFLKILFLSILIAMLFFTIVASIEKGVFEALQELWPDIWFRATLADAYFGFITFYVWIAYKERSAFARLFWLVFILGFGNIAMALYVLIKLFQLPAQATVQDLVIRQTV